MKHFYSSDINDALLLSAIQITLHTLNIIVNIFIWQNGKRENAVFSKEQYAANFFHLDPGI